MALGSLEPKGCCIFLPGAHYLTINSPYGADSSLNKLLLLLLNPVLKCSSDSSGFAMSSGREFHTAGPETWKLLGPKRRVLVRGVVRCPRAAERRLTRAPITKMGMQDWLRYVGPRPWSEFRTKVAILKVMCWRMGSQWSLSLSTGVMWSNFLVLVRTDCNLRRTAFVAP